MKCGSDDVHPLFDGVPACSLTDALEPNRLKAIGRGNLYLATANSLSPGSAQIIPKRFYDLIPHIKGSDFEYIIFDMPPLSPTSSTLAMAGFMDKVLLVAEAEVTNLDIVKRAYAELVSARADASIILNKSRSYGPKRLQDEL
jgi:MinD-like ATPase involved in chromosome partitioning or flagellar assembly